MRLCWLKPKPPQPTCDPEILPSGCTSDPNEVDGEPVADSCTDRHSANSSRNKSFVEDYPIWNIVKPGSRASLSASFIDVRNGSASEDEFVPLCERDFLEQICTLEYVLIVAWYTINLTWMVSFGSQCSQLLACALDCQCCRCGSSGRLLCMLMHRAAAVSSCH